MEGWTASRQGSNAREEGAELVQKLLVPASWPNDCRLAKSANASREIMRMNEPMRTKLWDVIILGGARDFHAMDWYRAVRRICPERNVVFMTDLLGGEGYANLAAPEDSVEALFIIDGLLCSTPSKLGHYWRNFVKLIVSPYQAVQLRRQFQRHGCKIVHAHPMYYMFLCWMAGVPYVGTPQGDELLIRPGRSRAYRHLASRVLRAATAIVVDSYQLQNAAKMISGIDALVIQNGINVDEIAEIVRGQITRFRVTSIRGIEPLYRINHIVVTRNNTAPDVALTLIYPFFDSHYLPVIRNLLKSQDKDLGRLDKGSMYRLLHESLLVISIPTGDSSPRSVYEAIFSGCCVAVTYNPWIDLLPECMRARVCVIDLANESWFNAALEHAKLMTKHPFVPSEKALELFDENRSLRRVADLFY